MDPRTNPYAPGAGSPPPELAGRDEIINRGAIALDRIRAARDARSLILYGLRGVGKTVLLNKITLDAEARGFNSVNIEAPEERSLPSLLIPALRSTLIKISKTEAVKEIFAQSMRTLGSFANAVKIKYADVTISTDFGKEAGVADSGDLALDLIDLLRSVGEAAKTSNLAIVLAIDELQYVSEEELKALLAAFHKISQLRLPIAMIAAGLPQLLGKMGSAKSYTERLFEFNEIDKLAFERVGAGNGASSFVGPARDALCKPAEAAGVSYTEDAVEEVLKQTRGYPYFLQEWGKHTWDIAASSPITFDDAKTATNAALAELDQGFFRVRFDRLTPSEKRYLRAMAELGPGPHRSGDIAEALKRKVTDVAPARSTLISKGMIFSPAHGDTAFTVPLFDGFMKRTMAMT